MDSFPWHQTPPRGSAEAGKGPGSRVELQLWGGGEEALSARPPRISRTFRLRARIVCVTWSALP